MAQAVISLQDSGLGRLHWTLYDAVAFLPLQGCALPEADWLCRAAAGDTTCSQYVDASLLLGVAFWNSSSPERRRLVQRERGWRENSQLGAVVRMQEVRLGFAGMRDDLVD